MSIVALKRKINAKKNISNTPITGLKVYNSAPGVNSKRGLVTRANGTVVNRNRRVQGRTYQAQEPNPYTIIVSSDTHSANNPVGENIAIGLDSLKTLTVGTNNVAIGSLALSSANGSEANNIAISKNALIKFFFIFKKTTKFPNHYIP